MDVSLTLAAGLAALAGALLGAWSIHFLTTRKTTRRMGELEDDLESLSKRMTKREGRDGGELRQAQRATEKDLIAEAMLARAAAAGPPAGVQTPKDRGALLRRSGGRGTGLSLAPRGDEDGAQGR